MDISDVILFNYIAGKMIPKNMIQAEFGHYPKQQHCCLEILEKMEDNGLYRKGLHRPFTLKAVSPAVGCIWGNVPVIGSLSDVYVRPCESVAKRPLPCESYRSFKQFKISTSDFDIVSMRRGFHACAYEFLL